MKSRTRRRKQKERYYLFVNPYTDEAFTKCPKCETKTKVRKYCLLIHIEPRQLVSLNKTCRYCPYCELVIVKKGDLESILRTICEKTEIMGNEYFVFGTMDRKDWKKLQENTEYSQTALENAYLFKDAWKFEVIRGWYPMEQRSLSQM